jgi:hypothetical protein
MLGATMKISVETARGTFIRFRLRCEQLEEFMVRYQNQEVLLSCSSSRNCVRLLQLIDVHVRVLSKMG